jgi:hypothetical protein
MEKEKLLNEISEGVAFIGNITYENFINAWQKDTDNYNNTAKLESEIGALFLFDYMISGQNVSQQFRQDFYTLCTDSIINRYKNKVENANLLESINYRYAKYAEIPAKSGEKWQRSLHDSLELNLKGTKGKNIIEETYPIELLDFFAEIEPKMAFIQSEVGNAYRTAKIVEELFKGNSLDEAIKIVQNLEKSITAPKQSKKKEGCYIATMIYGSYESEEVIKLRRFRDNELSSHLFGRMFIKIYYKFSPLFVRLFKNSASVNRLIKQRLDSFVGKYEKKTEHNKK